MTRRLALSRFITLIVAVSLLTPFQPSLAAQASAPASITANNDKALLVFPSQITFSVELFGSVTIQSAVLEYSVDQLTCGTVTAKAIPPFKPAKNVKPAWTWKMKDSGSLPPGAQVRWRWRVTDATGAQLLTDPRTVTWLDDLHPWQTLAGRQVIVHWYRGGDDFGRRMQAAGQSALATISQKLGLKPGRPIDLYLYADADEMRQAIFYNPDWSGGVAYPGNHIAIIGVSPAQEAWGKRAVAHEIAHIVVDTYGFSCLGSRPAWLDEGLATYIEGGPTPQEQELFKTAIQDDELLALSALDAGFGQDDYTVSLAYLESYSLVNFLVVKYGREKLMTAIGLLRDGATTTGALTGAYGFDEASLERAWRAYVGAKGSGAQDVVSTEGLGGVYDVPAH